MELCRIWSDIFEPMEGMEAMLRALREQGLRLVLLSNTNEWHFDFCARRFPALQLFHAHALSFRLKCRKPDPAIFRKALALGEAAPAEALFIDDIQAYVESARGLGIDSVCFTGVDPLKSELAARGLLALP